VYKNSVNDIYDRTDGSGLVVFLGLRGVGNLVGWYPLPCGLDSTTPQ
jgi:hypothetical protein